MWHAYPYTDAHELNLDWILSQIKLINTTLSNFIVMNTVKYADPFQWNITTQYESNTIVIDPNTGIAYISVQPVPAGISISNSDFWTPVFDLSQLFMSYNDNLTFHNEYMNIISAHPYSVGDWLVWKNELYLVTTAISIGDALQVGVNIQRKSIENLIDALKSDIDHEFTTVNDSITGLGNDINDLGNDLNDLRNDVTHDIGVVNTRISSFGIANVKEYGAVGDGVTDDTQAFADAIAANTHLYIPAGTYLLDEVVIDKDIIIEGSGVSSVLKCANTCTSFVKITNGGTYSASNFGLPKPALKNLVIDCDSKADNGLDLEYASWNTVENINIYMPISRGVYTHGAIGAGTRFNNILVRGNSAGNTTFGMYISSNDQNIENCTVIDCLNGFLGATSVRFENCSAWVSTSALFTASTAFRIQGRFCKIIDCWSDTMQRPVIIGKSADEVEIRGMNIINNGSVVPSPTYSYIYTFETREDGTQWYQHPVIIKDTFFGVDANIQVSNYPNIVNFLSEIDTPYFVDPSKRTDLGGASDYIATSDSTFTYKFRRIAPKVAIVNIGLKESITLAAGGAVSGTLELSCWSPYRKVNADVLVSGGSIYQKFECLVQTDKFFIVNGGGTSVTLSDLDCNMIVTF